LSPKEKFRTLPEEDFLKVKKPSILGRLARDLRSDTCSAINKVEVLPVFKRGKSA
jgi:hypothetical protein